MKKFLLLFFLLSISSNTLGFIRDSEIENLIKDIIAPIANAANQDKKKLKIFIIDDKQLNAFVTPGQKIFIFSGLILNSKNSNALEGVIAHELGHITGRHHIKIYEQLERSRAITLAGLILGTAVSVMTGDPNAAAAIAGGALSTSGRSLLNFSRIQEGSADQAGYYFLKKSGKSLCGIISFLELLEDRQIYYQENENDQDDYTITSHGQIIHHERLTNLSMPLYKNSVVIFSEAHIALAESMSIETKVYGVCSDYIHQLRSDPELYSSDLTCVVGKSNDRR